MMPLIVMPVMLASFGKGLMCFKTEMCSRCVGHQDQTLGDKPTPIPSISLSAGDG